MATSCGYEFQCKMFGFYDCKAHDFYVSQWGDNKTLFLIYRAFFFLYSLAWIIADVTVNYQPQYWVYLTNWSEVTCCLYLCIAFLTALYGYFTKADIDKEKGTNWGCNIAWVLFDVAFSVTLVTDVFFWAAVSRDTPSSVLGGPFNIHSHVITFIMLLIDLFVSAYPIRVLHILYGVCYGLVYSAFTLILHGSGYMSSIYRLIDWKDEPLIAIAVIFGMSFGAIPVAHLLAFGLYHLRAFIARKCSSGENDSLHDQLEMGQTNPGYTA